MAAGRLESMSTRKPTRADYTVTVHPHGNGFRFTVERRSGGVKFDHPLTYIREAAANFAGETTLDGFIKGATPQEVLLPLVAQEMLYGLVLDDRPPVFRHDLSPLREAL